MTDITTPQPEVGVPDEPIPAAGTNIVIPATPISGQYTVSDIPTIQLPLTKATKAHIAGGITAVIGVGQLAADIIPDGALRTYVQAGVAIIGAAAIYLGVYVAPNLPKISKK